ncbi:hypothetical protein [Bremerella sp. P1]|uniref:hypothetical protein n=1 Tax=Bremerella sp. P1 TaxID=3026424 RepID=UPI0023688554|nr:hypothetical protein [Bremerella sp. P1]WDI44321.1 hypothetical protein PSR63_10300 [Bremerella sp. P1]
MKLVLSKRRAKRLAAGTVFYSEVLGMWYLSLYMVVDGKAAPFGMTPHDNEADALSEGNETLKVTDSDWIDIEEEEVETYIATNAKHQWNPSGKDA